MKQWKKSLGIVLTAAAVTAATPVWAGAADPVQPTSSEAGGVQLDAPVTAVPISAELEGHNSVGVLPGEVDLPAVEAAGKVKWDDVVAITFDNDKINFDQRPIVSEEGILMVPLRAVIEAAGGSVEWDEGSRAVSASLAGRTALFRVGSSAAQLAPEVAPDTVAMAKAPVIIRGRTLISVDALGSVLGFKARARESGLLNLVLATAPGEEELPEQAQEEIKLTGTVTEINTEEEKILVEGAPMSNGEPNLTWVSLYEETEINIGAEGEEGGMADLEVGQEVEILLIGPILTSYPAQAGAGAVLILEG